MPLGLKTVPLKAPSATHHCGIMTSALPQDLDVGVIYSGERELMGPLLST